jgi:hypothetical protein
VIEFIAMTRVPRSSRRGFDELAGTFFLQTDRRRASAAITRVRWRVAAPPIAPCAAVLIRPER